VGYYMASYFSHSKYLALDLPETLLFSSYYLLREFPDKRFALCGEFDDLQQVIASGDIVLMPSWCAEELEEKTVDCFINMSSLPEMPFSTSTAFIELIKRVTKPDGIFYSDNSWEDEKGSTHKYPDIGMKTIFDKTKFLELFSMKGYPNPNILSSVRNVEGNRKCHIFTKSKR